MEQQQKAPERKRLVLNYYFTLISQFVKPSHHNRYTFFSII